MTYYDILEVSQTASMEVIRMAYKALAKKYHPDTYSGDKSFAEYKMKQVNEAFDILSSPEKRKAYNCTLQNSSPRYRQDQASATNSSFSSVPNQNASQRQSGNAASSRQSAAPKKKGLLLRFLSAISPFLFGVAIILSSSCDSSAGYSTPSNATKKPASSIEQTQPQLKSENKPHLPPEPATGLLSSVGEMGSELTVTAPSNASCLVKVKNSELKTIVKFYVRAGATYTARVPAEKMYVYFASGETWHGDKLLFGDGTFYSKDDDLLDFSQYTFEYTLQPITNGNFSETPIDASEF